MATDWQMPRRSDACASCGHSFAVGESLRAYLYESPAGYWRRDCCAQCRAPAQPRPLGFWKTRRPEPASGKTRPFDRRAIYELFCRLEDAAQPDKLRLRFVLALLLWRKKVLRFERSVRTAGNELWHFSVWRGGQSQSVVRPQLNQEQIEQLSAQLERLLAGQAPGPELPAAGASPAARPETGFADG